MTAIGLLIVAPIMDGDMDEEVSKAIDALEEFDVSYETNPMSTVIEADSVGELFAAAEAAHEAVDADRVGTTLKIDDQRTRDMRAEDKVQKVEDVLGREPVRERDD